MTTTTINEIPVHARCEQCGCDMRPLSYASQMCCTEACYASFLVEQDARYREMTMNHMTNNAHLTTAADLFRVVCDLLSDAADGLTQDACRDAMHAIGFTSYESLTDADVERIAGHILAAMDVTK